MIHLGTKPNYIEVYDRPGRYLCQVELNKLHQEILSVAGECLEDIPFYQCLTGERKEYERLIIAVARGRDGKMLGFCSSYLLDGADLGTILHLGLTCVRPLARRMGFTHKLTSKVVMTYLLRYSLFRPSWISNVACVLSSLGNVALHFENVFPSPFQSSPSPEQVKVAKLINDKFRWELYVNKDAEFEEETFVFKGSVTGTVFEKSESDLKYHHRNPELTSFYLSLINFETGDEVLQIGKVSLLTFPKYLLRSIVKKIPAPRLPKERQTVA